MKSLFRNFMFFVLLSAKGLYASGSGQVTEENFVFTAQFILKQFGYNVGTVDGLYGPKTGNALREFYKDKGITDVDWRAPIGWSGLNVSALSAFGPSERCFPVQADDSPMNCVA